MMDTKCGQPAAVRYTWAGRDESYACIEHAAEISRLADAMGYYIQFIPLGVDDYLKGITCQQIVKTGGGG
jgi:hypothetical protein